MLSAVRESMLIVQHPGVFRAAALARIDDERAGLQRDARETARHDADLVLAGEHERPQVDMARREAFLDQRRHGGERERRLRDEAARVALQLFAERLDRQLVGLRVRSACRSRPSRGPPSRRVRRGDRAHRRGARVRGTATSARSSGSALRRGRISRSRACSCRPPCRRRRRCRPHSPASRCRRCRRTSVPERRAPNPDGTRADRGSRRRCGGRSRRRASGPASCACRRSRL